ncbi:MAG: zinc-dependent alcohol dehydrogenase family protein [Verrucomicrobia bacterium]|nr:zinc-dependent alcohol dehydrogenase family protein [Verrucomicrobiota bacterium]
MKAIVYDAPRNFSYRDTDEPRIKPDEALIRVHACGLCGTDLHVHEGEFGPRFPLIPGHEFTGELVEIGSNVSGFKPGQRVVANSNLACGSCFYCLRGDFLLCENLSCYGINHNGGFAEYVKIKADRLFVINRLSPREAVMVEPTACALHGTEVLDAKPGSDVLLFGAGPTGQVLAQLVRLNGAARLVVAAPPGPKLDLAARLGADEVVPMDREDPEVHRRRLQALSPKGFDYVIEATGAPAVCQEALRFVRRRGTLLVYGVYPENASVRFNPFDLFRGEISIKGSFAQIDSFPRAIAYLESGKVKVDEIVTQEIPLPEYQQALDIAWARKGVKTALVPES